MNNNYWFDTKLPILYGQYCLLLIECFRDNILLLYQERKYINDKETFQLSHLYIYIKVTNYYIKQTFNDNFTDNKKKLIVWYYSKLVYI